MEHTTPGPSVVEVLVSQHERFLAFLVPRVIEPVLHATICACIGDLIPTLKPEYGEILRRVDLGGASVDAAAREAGVTANNAGVRLHRARKALLTRLREVCGTCTEHRCLDCHCKK